MKGYNCGRQFFIGIWGNFVVLVSYEDAIPSDLISSTLLKRRARGIKATKAGSKSKAYMGLESEKIDGLVGALAKVRKVVSDFSEAKVGNSVREEETMILQFLPEYSKHRKIISDLMAGRLESLIEDYGNSTTNNENTD